VKTLRERVIRATFIACNKTCTKLAPSDKEIKPQKILLIVNQQTIAVIIHLHQAHQTQTTTVPEN